MTLDAALDAATQPAPVDGGVLTSPPMQKFLTDVSSLPQVTVPSGSEGKMAEAARDAVTELNDAVTQLSSSADAMHATINTNVVPALADPGSEQSKSMLTQAEADLSSLATTEATVRDRDTASGTADDSGADDGSGGDEEGDADVPGGDGPLPGATGDSSGPPVGGAAPGGMPAAPMGAAPDPSTMLSSFTPAPSMPMAGGGSMLGAMPSLGSMPSMPPGSAGAIPMPTGGGSGITADELRRMVDNAKQRVASEREAQGGGSSSVTSPDVSSVDIPTVSTSGGGPTVSATGSQPVSSGSLSSADGGIGRTIAAGPGTALSGTLGEAAKSGAAPTAAGGGKGGGMGMMPMRGMGGMGRGMGGSGDEEAKNDIAGREGMETDDPVALGTYSANAAVSGGVARSGPPLDDEKVAPVRRSGDDRYAGRW